MDALHLLAFAPAALLMALTPGPSNLLAFANGATRGWGAAAAGVLGRLVAYAILIAAVAFGLGAALEASAGLAAAIKWLGVVYLAWLAWKIWSAPVEGGMAAASREARRTAGLGALARREFLTGIVNPKALVLFTAFLPSFVLSPQAAQAGFAAQLLSLGAVYLVMEWIGAATWAGAGALLGAGGMGPARRRGINRVSGGLLGLAALLLARAGRAA